VRRYAGTVGARWARWIEALDRRVSGRRPGTLALGALFLLTSLYHAAYAVQQRGFLIMTDELQYLKLGLNVPHSLLPELHGEYFASYNQLYSLVIAPLGAVIESVPALFISLHLLNPLLMASVVFPTYLLARELGVSRLAALIAAALSVAGPWLALTSLVMTENVAYPAFMWALLGMQRALAAPSLGRDLVALGGIALAASGRTQFLALSVVFLVAIFLERANYEMALARQTTGPEREEEESFKRGLRMAVAEHRELFLLTSAVALVSGMIAILVSPDKVVGIYGTVFEKPLLPIDLVSHMVEHAATITVAYGVVPMVVAGAYVVSALRNPSAREQHSFAWLLLLTTITVWFISSSFNLNFSAGGLNDRYVFYVLPLIGVAAVVGLAHRHTSLQSIAGAGAAVALLLPFGHYEGYDGAFWVGAPSSAIDPVLNGKLWQVNDLIGTTISIELALSLGALAVTVATLFLVRFWRGPVALATVALPLLVWLVAETQYQYDSQPSWERPTPGVISKSLRTESIGDVDWIDKAVPSGSVALAPSVTLDQIAWWQDEFFNRRVDKMFRVVNPSQPERYSKSLVHLQLKTLFHDEIRIDALTGAITGLPPRRMTPYIVTAKSEVRFGFAGERALSEHPEPRRKAPSNRRLLRVDVPYRAAWLVQNVLDDGWTVGGETGALFFPRANRDERWNVRLTLRSPVDVKRTRSWSVQAGKHARISGRLRPTKEATARVSLCVRARATPTKLSLRVPEKTKLPDGRSVGLILVELDALPTSRSCADRGSADESRAPTEAGRERMDG
jgi:hypothetical protein